jgi:hypothetical protein
MDRRSSFFIYFIACVLMLAAGIWLTVKTNVGYVPPDVPLIVRVFGPVLLLASLDLPWDAIQGQVARIGQGLTRRNFE